jgi:hypothetical protein
MIFTPDIFDTRNYSSVNNGSQKLYNYNIMEGTKGMKRYMVNLTSPIKENSQNL